MSGICGGVYQGDTVTLVWDEIGIMRRNAS